MARREYWTVARCKAVIQRFKDYTAENNISTTIREYNKWRTGSDLPSPETILATLGSWTAAKMKATGEVSRHGTKWSDKDCDFALDRFVSYCQEVGVNPSRYRYEIWCKSNTNCPSYGALCRRGKSAFITGEKPKVSNYCP